MASRKSKTSTDAQQSLPQDTAAPADGAAAQKKSKRSKRAESPDGGQAVRKRKARGPETTGTLVRAGEEPVNAPAPVTDAPAPEPAVAPASIETPVCAPAAPVPAPVESVEPSAAPQMAAPQGSSAPESGGAARLVSEAPVATLRSAPMQAPTLSPAGFPGASLQDLPFPSPRSAIAWSEATSAVGRVHAAVRALTTSLQVLAAAQLATLSLSRYRDRLRAAAHISAGGYLDGALSPSAWSRLAFGLSPMASQAGEGPIPGAAGALADAGGLASEIESALLASGGVPDLPEAFAESRQGELADLLRMLAAVCKPLRHVRLVGVLERDVSHGDDRLCYQGVRFGAEPSETIAVWTGRALSTGWCYLMEGSTLLASLAPVMSVVRCPLCGKVEPCAAERLGVAQGKGLTVHCAGGCSVPRFHWPLARATSIWTG